MQRSGLIGATPPAKHPALGDKLLAGLTLSLGLLDGALYNLLPVSFSELKNAFSLDVEQLARIQTFFFLSTLVFSVFGGAFLVRLGLRNGAIVSLLGIAAGVAMIGTAPAFGVVIAGAFVFGLSLVGIEVAGSAVISEHFAERRQSLFFAWGISNAAGAALGPILFGSIFEHVPSWGFDWRACFIVAAGIPILFAMGWILLRPKQDLRAPAEQPSSPMADWIHVLRQPAIYGVSLLILLHGIAQIGMVTWIGQLPSHREAGGNPAQLISVNSVGFFIGRSFLTALTAKKRISELLVLTVAGVGAAIFFSATIAVPQQIPALILFALAGVFVSADGPSINALVGQRFAGHAATAFAIMTGAGNLGAAAGPYMVGAIGSRLGLVTGIKILPLFSLALGVFSAIWLVSQRRRAGKSPP